MNAHLFARALALLVLVLLLLAFLVLLLVFRHVRGRQRGRRSRRSALGARRLALLAARRRVRQQVVDIEVGHVNVVRSGRRSSTGDGDQPASEVAGRLLAAAIAAAANWYEATERHGRSSFARQCSNQVGGATRGRLHDTSSRAICIASVSSWCLPSNRHLQLEKATVSIQIGDAMLSRESVVLRWSVALSLFVHHAGIAAASTPSPASASQLVMGLGPALFAMIILAAACLLLCVLGFASQRRA